MSLMSTLAKVAVGVAVAKGASSMMNKPARGASGTAASGGLGGLLGSLMGGANAPGGQAGGSFEDMLGGLLGGGQPTQAGASSGAQTGAMPGGLGGLLEQLGGAGGKGSLQDVLGGLAGAGGAGGLLGGLASALGSKPDNNDSSFGSVLNSAFDQNPEPAIEPTDDQEAAAGLMLGAMIQAAKADGKLDDSERQKLIGRLGDDVSREEAEFVQSELNRPVDVDALVKKTPGGMETQIYAMSVLGIDLDSQDEARYLHKLATGYGLDAATVNGIHKQMGVPSLYA